MHGPTGNRAATVGMGAAAIALLALLSAPLPAAAQGTITGLALTPPSPGENVSFTVTVQGTGKCKTIDVDFGDNSPAATLDNPNLGTSENNTTDPHAYAPAGSYTITATAVEQCTGQASQTVNVQTAGAPEDDEGMAQVLCKITDSCAGAGTAMGPAQGKSMTYLRPSIEAMFPGPITPGADVLILGGGFGEGKPEATLKLVDANLTATLSVFDHSDGFVAATVPADLTNLVDQPADIFIKRAGDGALSAARRVTFTAAREVRPLPAGDPALKLVTCDDDANVNSCYLSADYGHAIHAGHANCWGCVGDDAGTDKYSVNLKNGWVIDEMFFTELSEGTAKEPGFPLDASSAMLAVPWKVSPNSTVIYDIDFAIRGPKGIPWH